MRILSVVGARPNFMKIAPFIRAIEKHNKTIPENYIHHTLVHTGQHYDDRMSMNFFEELDIPQADINLGIGSGSHAEQVGNAMIALEKIFIERKPDWVVVVGDVNATLAASVTAKKLLIKVCHIEAGLRSGDMTMPEEINRLVTDRLSDLLLTPDRLSSENLLKEGIHDRKIRFVGNIMIDTLQENKNKAEARNIEKIVLGNLSEESHKTVKPGFEKQTDYALITLHRPSNVDTREILESIIKFFIHEVSREVQIIWPVHPRTEKQLKRFGLWSELISHQKIFLLKPLGYIDMLSLNMGAKLMFTDSGGLQEECTVLGTPCITLRRNTERPVTLQKHKGLSVLAGNDINKIKSAYNDTLNSTADSFIPELWDGKTAERCVKEILNFDHQSK